MTQGVPKASGAEGETFEPNKPRDVARVNTKRLNGLVTLGSFRVYGLRWTARDVNGQRDRCRP